MLLASYKSNLQWIYEFKPHPRRQRQSSVRLRYLKVFAMNSSKDCSIWLLVFWNTCREYCMLSLICCVCVSGKHSDFMCNKSSIADITSAGAGIVFMGRGTGWRVWSWRRGFHTYSDGSRDGGYGFSAAFHIKIWNWASSKCWTNASKVGGRETILNDFALLWPVLAFQILNWTSDIKTCALLP